MDTQTDIHVHMTNTQELEIAQQIDVSDARRSLGCHQTCQSVGWTRWSK